MDEDEFAMSRTTAVRRTVFPVASPGPYRDGGSDSEEQTGLSRIWKPFHPIPVVKSSSFCNL